MNGRMNSRHLFILVVALLIISCAVVAATSFTSNHREYEAAADYVTVDAQNGANIFYWLYKLKDQAMNDKDPLVVWLQGGPGASSAMGDFCEIGPIDLCGEASKPQNRSLTWMDYANALIFVDQPVGSGYSYVLNKNGYAKSEDDLVRHFITVMKQMFLRFPSFHNKPLWIFSESYGGKMNSNIAVGLLKAGIPGLKLTGVALGDSWISPQDAVNSYGKYLQALSHVDDQSREQIDMYASKIETALENNQFEAATDLWGSQQELIISAAGSVSFYNFLRHTEYTYDNMTKYMNEEQRKKFNSLLPVGKTIPNNIKWDLESGDVFTYLYADFMKPSVAQVEQLLEAGIKVIVYSGQLDVIVDVLSTEAWINRMKNWSGLSSWQKTANVEVRPKLPNPENTDGILGNTNIAFRKKYENFELWKVLFAGHMVPQDNPVCALEMFRRVTDDSYDKARTVLEARNMRRTPAPKRRYRL